MATSCGIAALSCDRSLRRVPHGPCVLAKSARRPSYKAAEMQKEHAQLPTPLLQRHPSVGLRRVSEGSGFGFGGGETRIEEGRPTHDPAAGPAACWQRSRRCLAAGKLAKTSVQTEVRGASAASASADRCSTTAQLQTPRSPNRLDPGIRPTAQTLQSPHQLRAPPARRAPRAGHAPRGCGRPLRKRAAMCDSPGPPTVSTPQPVGFRKRLPSATRPPTPASLRRDAHSPRPVMVPH